MGEHTPGPWVVAFDDEIDGLPVIVIETDKPVGPELRPVCHVQPTFDGGDNFSIEAEDRANAALIAAAPDLKEAGKALAEAVAAYRLTHDVEGDGHIKTGRAWDLMKRREIELRAAIAKASLEGGG